VVPLDLLVPELEEPELVRRVVVRLVAGLVAVAAVVVVVVVIPGAGTVAADARSAAEIESSVA